jgi:hypothetical protein
MVSFTSEALKRLQSLGRDMRPLCLRIHPAGAV